MINPEIEDGQQLFGDIRNPEQVQNINHEVIQARIGRYTAGISVVVQLERIEEMLLRGSITQSEFGEQKRRIIN